MVRNWVANTRALHTRLDSYFVAATDAASVAALAAEGVPVVDYSRTGLAAGATNFQTTEYNRIVDHRWEVLAAVLDAGYNAFLVDADAVLQRNPLPYIQTLPPDCDGYIAIDIALNEGSKDTVLKRGGYAEDDVYNFMNMGLFLMRAGPRSSAVVTAFRTYLGSRTKGDSVDDQTKWNTWFQTNYRIRGLKNESKEARGAAVVDAVMHSTCVDYVATSSPAGQPRRLSLVAAGRSAPRSSRTAWRQSGGTWRIATWSRRTPSTPTLWWVSTPRSRCCGNMACGCCRS